MIQLKRFCIFSRTLFFPRLTEELHGQVACVPALGQYGQPRALDPVSTTLDTQQFAFLLQEKGVVGMVNAIVPTRAVVNEDGRPALSQVGDGQQRGAHGLLNRKKGANSQIVGMSDVARNQGARGATRNRDSLWVEVVLRRVGLEEANCLGAMIHDLEVVLPHVREKRVVDAREGNPLRVVFAQHGTA